MMIYHFDNIGPTKFQIRITTEEHGIWTEGEDMVSPVQFL